MRPIIGRWRDTSLLILPALTTGLATIALGEWRLPVDALVASALILSLRSAKLRFTACLAYLLLLLLFLLRAYNIEISSYAFYLQFLGQAPVSIGLVAASLGVILSCAGLSLWAPRPSPTGTGLFFSVALLLMTAHSFSWSHRLGLSFPAWTLSSDIAAMLRSAEAGGPVAKLRPENALHTVLEGRVDAQSFDQILLIVVESWASAPTSLAKLVDEVRVKFGTRVTSVESGFTTAIGATLSGELRELCGQYLALTEAAHVDTQQCLPARLQRLGFATVAAHGYHRGFYMRGQIYPHLGFSKAIFLEDVAMKLPHCAGAFDGICDMEMLGLLIDTIGERQSFGYFVSLQSHEPITRQRVVRAPQTLGDPPVSAVLAQAFARDAIDAVAARVGPCRRLVMLVGDHPPPSIADQTRVVPFIRFSIQEAKCAGR